VCKMNQTGTHSPNHAQYDMYDTILGRGAGTMVRVPESKPGTLASFVPALSVPCLTAPHYNGCLPATIRHPIEHSGSDLSTVPSCPPPSHH
jgi:hypothetical protein